MLQRYLLCLKLLTFQIVEDYSMINKLFWHAAVLAMGIGSCSAYAAAAANDQGQEPFLIMTAEESAAIQKKLNTLEDAEKKAFQQQQYQEFVKRAESAGYVMPTALPTEKPAEIDTSETAVSAAPSPAKTEPKVAAKPVEQATPKVPPPPVQTKTPDEVSPSSAPQQETAQADTEVKAIEAHKAKMAQRGEIIKQAAEQQELQQKKLAEQQQEAAPSRPATDATSARQAMDQHRQQVVAEIEKRREEIEKARLESGKTADASEKQRNDALETLAAHEEARKQEMAQHREAAEMAMQARHAEMERRIQQRQDSMPPSPRISREETMPTRQDHRAAMREYMARHRAEQEARQEFRGQENRTLALAEEDRARMVAMYKQRQVEIAARRRAMHQRINTAIEGMGRYPWGAPPPHNPGGARPPMR
jgi:hypothetical protein